MWHRIFLKKVGTASKEIGWSRYVFLRRFSEKNIQENENKISESEENLKKLLNDSAAFNEHEDNSWPTSPYPHGVVILGKEERPKQDPTEISILLFPGQGMIKIGEINNYLRFPRVKEVFEICNEILNYDVLKMLQRGPKEKINRTEFNQAATLAMSMAAIERLWEERPRAVENCKAVAGYSVGELAALVFTGVITMEDGIRLAAVRGAAMQTASDNESQGMLSVYCKPVCKIGEALEEAKNYAMDLGISQPVCSTAIYLHPQTKIIGGHEECLQYIEKNYVKLGFRHLRRLPVSGAFHTELMKPAVNSFKKALDKVDIHHPRVPVYCNVTGNVYNHPETIKKMLLKQLFRPVKWEQILHTLFSRTDGTNFPRCFDMASGGIMKGILGKVNSKAANSCFNI